MIKKILDKIVKTERYGKITDIEKYLEENYPGEDFSLSETSSLTRNINYHIAGRKNKSDCTIVAISTIMELHSKFGYFREQMDYDEIYGLVLKSAGSIGAYPIPVRGGTFPFLADNIIRKFFKIVGAENYRTRNIYSFSWNKSEKKKRIMVTEILNRRPFVLNISFGDYKNHSVTGIGYSIYKSSKGKEVFFLELADGWSRIPKYIDMNRFSIIASMTVADPGIRKI